MKQFSGDVDRVAGVRDFDHVIFGMPVPRFWVGVSQLAVLTMGLRILFHRLNLPLIAPERFPQVFTM
jgi:hypothetical protein